MMRLGIKTDEFDKRRVVEGNLVAEDIEMADVEKDDIVIRNDEYGEVIHEEFITLLGNWIESLPIWLRPIVRFYYRRR